MPERSRGSQPVRLQSFFCMLNMVMANRYSVDDLACSICYWWVTGSSNGSLCAREKVENLWDRQISIFLTSFFFLSWFVLMSLVLTIFRGVPGDEPGRRVPPAPLQLDPAGLGHQLAQLSLAELQLLCTTTASTTGHCGQLAFFNARFHKTGIFKKRLALKIFNFIYCLALKFYTVCCIYCLAFKFLETINETSTLAFLVPGFGIGPA